MGGRGQRSSEEQLDQVSDQRSGSPCASDSRHAVRRPMVDRSNCSWTSWRSQLWHWTWDHTGTEITWYDWMRNEPNDWHGQNCLTFLKWGDPVGFGIYHWNDWDCNQLARFICERPGASVVEA